MYDRIDNGGLCLRKVAAFNAACTQYSQEISYFLSQGDNGLYYEDIFGALIPKEFNYSDVKTALTFAYDLKPRLCHKLYNDRLPMGCHGFMRKHRINFWKQFIPV